MSAKTSTRKIDWAAPRLKGKTFAFADKLSYMVESIRQNLLETEGAKTVKEVTPKLDYLVVGETRGTGPSTAEKKATRLVQTKGAAICSRPAACHK